MCHSCRWQRTRGVFGTGEVAARRWDTETWPATQEDSGLPKKDVKMWCGWKKSLVGVLELLRLESSMRLLFYAFFDCSTNLNPTYEAFQTSKCQGTVILIHKDHHFSIERCHDRFCVLCHYVLETHMLDVAWGMLFSIPDQDLALQRLAALGVSQLRLWSSLPLNPATAKVLWLYRVGGQSSYCISNMLIILSVGWWDPLRDWNFARDLLVDTRLTSQAFHLNFTHWVFSPRFLKQNLHGPSKYKYESLPKWDAFEGAYTWWFKNPKE